MFNNKLGNVVKLGMFLIVIMTVMQPVSAGTLYAGNMTSENDAVTYENLQNAIDNASSGDTIEVSAMNYNESYDVTTDNLTIERYSGDTGTATVNATQEKYGDAFYGQYAHNLSTGTNVAVQENVFVVNQSQNETIADRIDNASDNANISSNFTLALTPGEYNHSVNVSYEYVAFVNHNPNDGNVTINAKPTNYSKAFRGEFAEDVRVGYHVQVKESVFGIGGGFGDSLTMKFMGIPLWAIAIVALLLGYVWYEESN